MTFTDIKQGSAGEGCSVFILWEFDKMSYYCNSWVLILVLIMLNCVKMNCVKTQKVWLLTVV